ncbi:MAG: amino acid ABC transporter ATP-binding protein [Clostridia bacterium]|nr:amino acid ABC transporter ATP-binding protein [Clostridia bacterium]
MSDKKVIVKAVAKEAAPAVKAAPKKPLYNPKGDVLISVKNLDKTFKGTIHAVRNVTTDIHKGEVVVLIGPSGSGKSTFLRCLNLLEVPTAGSITMDGEDIMDRNADLNKHRQKVGMVFQHFNLFDNLNVIQNMTIAPIKLKGGGRPGRDGQSRRRAAAHRLCGHPLHPACAEQLRPRRSGLVADATAGISRLAVSRRQRRHHHLGTLGRHQAQRFLLEQGYELLQSLRLRRGGGLGVRAGGGYPARRGQARF